MHDPEDILTNGPTRIWSALDAMDDLFYVFDVDQRLVAWNDSFRKVTGYSDDELLGMSPFDFVRQQDHDDLRSFLERIGERGSGALQVEFLTKDGDTIPYEFYSDSLTDEDGAVIGRVGVGRDITERVEYERALERENERLDEFASTLAHDLRNPLTVAQGRVEILETNFDKLENSEVTAHLNTISDAHSRIERIIDDVLELAEAGELVAEQEEVELAEIARQRWANVEHGRAQLTVDTDMTVRADVSLLKRMLTNLFRNAIEYGDDTVHVRIDSLTEAAGFYVADDGPGIPPDERDRVFDWKHTNRAGGFGIGLQSVQRICDAHSWDITVTESKRGGAQFEITGVTVDR